MTHDGSLSQVTDRHSDANKLEPEQLGFLEPVKLGFSNNCSFGVSALIAMSAHAPTSM